MAVISIADVDLITRTEFLDGIPSENLLYIIFGSWNSNWGLSMDANCHVGKAVSLVSELFCTLVTLLKSWHEQLADLRQAALRYHLWYVSLWMCMCMAWRVFLMVLQQPDVWYGFYVHPLLWFIVLVFLPHQWSPWSHGIAVVQMSKDVRDPDS